MRTNIPKMSLAKLSLYISEWFLLSENSESWVDEPQVLIAWHALFFTSVALFLIFCVPILFQSFFEASSTASYVFRLITVLVVGILILIFSILSAAYYRHLLLTGRDLRFSSVANFWVGWITLFGLLYRGCYFIRPSFFSWEHPLIVPGATLEPLNYFKSLQIGTEFILYSACTATAVPLHGFTPNSTIISAFNVVETIGSVLIIGLLVATFVGKATASRMN